MGCGSRFADGGLKDVQTVRKTVVEAHGHAAGRYTNQLLQFREVERVVRLQEQVIPANGEYNFLLLVDDMRREHE